LHSAKEQARQGTGANIQPIHQEKPRPPLIRVNKFIIKLLATDAVRTWLKNSSAFGFRLKSASPASPTLRFRQAGDIYFLQNDYQIGQKIVDADF
tara:strand:+ start:328 stop:612 length:285 start_codon:yes stop_codon:yes gene_type:complete